MHWQPMSEMKDEYRGRKALVITCQGYEIVTYCKETSRWQSAENYNIFDDEITHFMLIEPPGEEYA